MITVTEQEIREWARMAQDAYRTGWNGIGHLYSAAAAQGAGPMPTERYDVLQEGYRIWLVFGWPIEGPSEATNQ